jgi:lipid-binding SYLF domain-containing protein
MRRTQVAVIAIAGFIGVTAFAADREAKVEDRLDASAETLGEMMHASDSGVPQDLIDKARCVVVVPGMKKAGFIFGAKYGRGFAVCHRAGGVGWTAPQRWPWKVAALDSRSALLKPTWFCWL